MIGENSERFDDFCAVQHLPPINFYRIEQDEDTWTAFANHYVNHEFNLLGSGWVRVYYGMMARGFEGRNYSNTEVTCEMALNEIPEFYRAESRKLLELAGKFVEGYCPIDWFIDFKSGYRYGFIHYSEIRYGVVDGVDAKVPYDLSRCCHLTVLAKAWQISGNDRYRKEIMAQILDWISMNPQGYGIGWHANMNAAIRLVNWIVAYSIIQHGISANSEDDVKFLDIFYKSLLEHRQFISENLEFAETSIHPNHYIADIGGLLLGSRFLEAADPGSRSWKRMAIREICLELDRQIGRDGFDYESTTNYHAFGLEMFIIPLILCAKASGYDCVKEIRRWLEAELGSGRVEKIKRMFGALRDITQPDNTIPLVGDADSGRFLYLELPGRDGRDWRFLSCIGATLFEDNELLPDQVDEADWHYAKALFKDLIIPKAFAPADPKSICYPYAGFYILKSRDIFSLVFCGPIGTQGIGGHAHDDKLSFTLSIKGLEFIVDPGIYVYTASKKYRDEYRSVLSHNTVCLANQPQNRLLEGSPWWGCYEDTRCKVLHCKDNEDTVSFAGQHEGYLRLPEKIIHKREIELKKKGGIYSIKDSFISRAGAEIYPPMLFNLMLHNECEVVLKDEKTALVKRDNILLEVQTGFGSWHIADGFFSPAYGVKKKSVRLSLEMAQGVPENRITIKW